ncbi:Rrf2 family transcriptional regulator, partial [bacterium]|nr:Rrf2 family transcriptional regulator [bacterium]
MITATTEYAIRAIGYLAMQDPDERIGSDEIAEHTGVPKRFLLKILNTLKNQGLIQANRGIGGGFRLAKPAESITLYTV